MATMFSMAVTCPALSPSNLPAAVDSWAPFSLAAFSAPSFIFTKNGLVSVLVIRPTLTLPESELDEPEPDPQAVMVSAATPVTAAILRREEDRRVVRDMIDSCGIAGGTGLRIRACRPGCHR